MYYAIFIFTLTLVGLWFSIKPRNDRSWSPDQTVLPHAAIADDTATIFNIRNFIYSSEKAYEPRFYDRTFSLSDLVSLDYIVTPFSKIPGIAHAFVSFGFADHRHLAISVEVRKKIGDSYSIMRSFVKGYELMYVIADESDVIRLRTNHRGDRVHIYRLDLTNDAIKKVLVDMLERANKLKDHPEFYNPITNTCTTNIMKHLNVALQKKIPFHYTMIFPRWSDKFFHKLGLIEAEKGLPFREIKLSAMISERARGIRDDDPAFSQKIREKILS